MLKVGPEMGGEAVKGVNAGAVGGAILLLVEGEKVGTGTEMGGMLMMVMFLVEGGRTGAGSSDGIPKRGGKGREVPPLLFSKTRSSIYITHGVLTGKATVVIL